MIKQHVILGTAFMIANCLISIAHADNTITDPESGCKVLNSKPLKLYSVSWHGACKDGYADGIGSLQWYSNGKPSGRYDGEYKAGKMDGLGTFAMPNGSRHTGHYLNNMRNSQGVYLWEDGTRYEGQFFNNMMHGEGATQWPDGSSHVGEYKHDKKNGFGTMRLIKQNPHITQYEKQGQWQGDFLEIQGIFLEDNLLLTCRQKAECLQKLSSHEMVLNEAKNNSELKEIFKEIADNGE